MTEDIIRIDHLSKSFRDVKAVDDLSFRVREGELFAFLGVNGAGKSTTINMLCGQLSRDEGEIEIDGERPEGSADEIKRKIGVVDKEKDRSGVSEFRSRFAPYGL